MALLDWSLSHEMSPGQWATLMKAVSHLAEKGLPLLLEGKSMQGVAPEGSRWMGWLLKKQHQQFIRMNTPAFRWGLQGQGFDSVRMELLPGPKAVDSLEEATVYSVFATRLPHQGTVEVGPHLHAFAWWGALLWAQQRWPGCWRLSSTLPQAQSQDVQRWAIEVMKTLVF